MKTMKVMMMKIRTIVEFCIEPQENQSPLIPLNIFCWVAFRIFEGYGEGGKFDFSGLVFYYGIGEFCG